MLEMFYHHLSNNEEVIYRSLIPNESTVLTLYTFFLDKDGCYIDTTTIGKEFIDVSIKYLTLYSQLMNHNEQTFANKKNLLFMEDVTNNLLNIIETLDVKL